MKNPADPWKQIDAPTAARILNLMVNEWQPGDVPTVALNRVYLTLLGDEEMRPLRDFVGDVLQACTEQLSSRDTAIESDLLHGEMERQAAILGPAESLRLADELNKRHLPLQEL